MIYPAGPKKKTFCDHDKIITYNSFFTKPSYALLQINTVNKILVLYINGPLDDGSTEIKTECMNIMKFQTWILKTQDFPWLRNAFRSKYRGKCLCHVKILIWNTVRFILQNIFLRLKFRVFCAGFKYLRIVTLMFI